MAVARQFCAVLRRTTAVRHPAQDSYIALLGYPCRNARVPHLSGDPLVLLCGRLTDHMLSISNTMGHISGDHNTWLSR